MNQKTFKALERVFAKEIVGQALFSDAKIYQELAKKEMLRVIPKEQTNTKVPGYELTHYGRISYCAQCPEVTE